MTTGGTSCHSFVLNSSKVDVEGGQMDLKNNSAIRKAWMFLMVLMSFIVPPVLAETPTIAMDGQKIVTGSTIRMREQPSLEGDISGRVGLGTVVRATKRTKEPLQTGELDDYWYFVRSGGLQGWVSAVYLKDYKPEQREKIWFGIIKERIDNPDLSFVDRMSLHRFTKLASKYAQDEKLQGAFELGELLALQKSFDLVNADNAGKEPFASWIADHQAANNVFLDEISGQWLVPAKKYWALADAYTGRAGADEAAWYAANARLGGECEGDIACNLERELITQGEYLKRHPHGRYAGASLSKVSQTLVFVLEALEQQPNYFREAPESGKTVEALFDVIANSNLKLSERAKAFGQIKKIRRAVPQ